MNQLPHCRWRSAALTAGRIACNSAKLVGNKSALDPSICARCPYVDHDPIVAKPKSATTTAKISLPLCVYLGNEVHPPKAPDNVKDWRECERGHGIICPCGACKTCRDHAIVVPDRIARVDPSQLVANNDQRHFNAGLVRYRGRLVMAYRAGWVGSKVAIAVLGDDLQPIENRTLNLLHPMCSAGQEDPRLFIHRDGLYLSFTGLEIVNGGLVPHVMLAKLTDALEAGSTWYPHYTQRARTEKNWVFFSHDDELFCVYGTYPEHVILSVCDVATLAHSTPTKGLWPHGTIRGGASPVRAGDEYYHWFHSWKRSGELAAEYYHYCAGVLTFEAKPPFRVTRMTPGAVWQPENSWRSANVTPDKNVIYPCGAILENGRWLVSAGHQDTWCEIAEFDADEIDNVLVRV